MVFLNCSVSLSRDLSLYQALQIPNRYSRAAHIFPGHKELTQFAYSVRAKVARGAAKLHSLKNRVDLSSVYQLSSVDPTC